MCLSKNAKTLLDMFYFLFLLFWVNLEQVKTGEERERESSVPLPIPTQKVVAKKFFLYTLR